jgi:hypothetical protein
MSSSTTWLEILAHPFRFYELSFVHIAFLVFVGLGVGLAYILGLSRKLKLSPQIDWWAYLLLGVIGSFGTDVVMSFLVYYFFWPKWMYANRLALVLEDVIGAFVVPFIIFKPFS